MVRTREELQEELARINAHLDALAVELEGIGKRASAGRQVATKKRDAERIKEIRGQLGLE